MATRKKVPPKKRAPTAGKSPAKKGPGEKPNPSHPTGEKPAGGQAPATDAKALSIASDSKNGGLRPDGKDAPKARAILFYDGECGLCDRTVKVFLRLDRRGRLNYAPLQGKTAADLGLSPDGEPSTLILLDGRGLHKRSSGAFRALGHLGLPWNLLVVGLVIPRPLRDLGYRAVARVRKRFFPPPDACAMPRPGERKRFLP